MSPLIAPALRILAAAHPAIRPTVTERYGPDAVAALRLGDLDVVLTEYDAASPSSAEPGLGLRQLAFDPSPRRDRCHGQHPDHPGHPAAEGAGVLTGVGVAVMGAGAGDGNDACPE
jgi:hypothetical protein